MSMVDKAFSGAIPDIYDRYLGPLIFEPYATDIAERLAELAGTRLLETAAGTGIVARELARNLPATWQIVATDLNQPMLDFAAVRLTSPRVSWRQADASRLPFEDASFDVVVCQFGVMFFPDRVGAYREVRRVLKPRGHFVFNVWDKIEENEFAALVTGAMIDLFPDDPPLFLARTPHGHHDTETIRNELQEAGFAQAEIETIARRSRAESPSAPAIGYCQGTPLRHEIEKRDRTRLHEATEAATQSIAARFGSGHVDGKTQAHVITTRKIAE